MARKKTYIYHMLIGHNNNKEADIFMYARNADVAKEFCKEKYRENKYNSYKAIKVGLSKTLKETMIITGSEETKLRNSIASHSDGYREINTEASTPITNEEAGE